MKTSLLLVLLFVLGVQVNAQQKPYFTQYIQNNYILNPALSGIENYTDVKLSYRNQWNDIVGAPVTMYFSLQGPIGKKDYRTNALSFEMPGENPLGKTYWENYEAQAPHGGVGIIAMNDQTGYINRGSVYATIAYHVGISPRTTISAGFLGGLSKLSLDRSKIEWATLDPNDPAIGFNDDLKKITPEVGAGIWVYSADYFLGASVLNIVPGKMNFSPVDSYGNFYAPQYLATAGYRFFLNYDVSALPSVMVQFVKPYDIQVHYNMKLMYHDKLWAGLSYRQSDDLGGFMGSVGMNISSTFNLSYAYDVSTRSKLRSHTGNTHEIIIGFLLNNRYGDTCPRNIW